jgi:hypothetical protein
MAIDLSSESILDKESLLSWGAETDQDPIVAVFRRWYHLDHYISLYQSKDSESRAYWHIL